MAAVALRAAAGVQVIRLHTHGEDASLTLPFSTQVTGEF